MKEQIKKYREIKAKYKDTVVLFRNGNYYELLYGDAKIA